LAAKLSGGERQLVALARALANRPRLVLADEPTGSVDTSTGQRLLNFLFADGEKTQASMVLVTHDPAVAARAHRVLLMRDGRLPA
jgi:putative ABC transport system ATP-binding protein